MILKNFLFHRVSEETDLLWPPMKPAHFERIIAYLTSHYKVVPLEQYLHNPSSFTGGGRLASVLFDDGYKDNIEYAVPILKKYNCPASFYIVTDCIDRNIPTWTYLVDNIFQQTHTKCIYLDSDFVPQQLKEISLAGGNNSPDVKAVKPWMKTLSNSRRVHIMQSMFGQCADVPLPVNKMMNWDDIRQMDRDGFIIGSHSHTHPMLASLSGEEEIKDELTVSFNKILAATGKPPLSISYPIGSFDERVKRISAETGYQFGLAVKQQFYQSSRDNLFEIPRVELYQEPWWKTKARVSGIYSAVKRLWK
jgi:peptidoglycan/xylan/chitin deacetylase (PgdA/CDA1 family)